MPVCKSPPSPTPIETPTIIPTSAEFHGCVRVEMDFNLVWLADNLVALLNFKLGAVLVDESKSVFANFVIHCVAKIKVRETDPNSFACRNLNLMDDI